MCTISCNMTSSCNYFMLIWFLVLNIQDYRNTYLCERWRFHHCIHTQTKSTLNSQSWNYNLWIPTSDVLSYILKYMYCMCLLLSPDCSFFLLFITFAVLLWPFNLWEWPASNFSFQYHPWIKHLGHENKGNDNKLKNLLIVRQILLASTLKNV